MSPSVEKSQVFVHYIVPFSGNGTLELQIVVPLSVTGSDAGFILKVMELVNAFAAVTCPAAARPEIPAVLRGVVGSRQ